MDVLDSILEEAAAFASGVLDPINRIGDKEGCTWNNGEVTTPKGFKEAYKKFADAGWIGLPVPAAAQGRELLDAAPGRRRGPPEVYSESLYLRFHFGWSEQEHNMTRHMEKNFRAIIEGMGGKVLSMTFAASPGNRVETTPTRLIL